MNSILHNIFRKVTRIINRRRLKNRDFSIITDSCFGGVISHELGLPFRSPTVNCWMHNKDFYKFAQDLKHYMSVDLQFIESNEGTPVAKCDDVTIHFNHYHSEQEAAEKWYARRKRINWNNIFLVTSDRPNDDLGGPVTDDEIRSLGKLGYQGIMVVSCRNVEGVDYIYKYDKDPDGNYAKTYMLDKDPKWGIWKWEWKMDYVYWLNTGKIKK